VEQIADWLAGQNLAQAANLSEKISEYLQLLARWNQKIRLTAIHEPDELLERHFGEAFLAARAVPITAGILVDIGSGAGFPAVPIKLVIPAISVALIEANHKKCAFLKDLVQRLELKGVQVVQARIEDLPPRQFSSDIITARAVGQFAAVLEWSHQALRPNGSLVLWLGGKAADPIQFEKDWEWRSPIPIPESRERFILIGAPRKTRA